jgi:hypothetical protein
MKTSPSPTPPNARLLFFQLHLDGFADRVNRFQIEIGFDGHLLAGQILGHSP